MAFRKLQQYGHFIDSSDSRKFTTTKSVVAILASFIVLQQPVGLNYEM